MSILTKKHATTALNLIVAVPTLITLAKQGAAAGRAILDAIKGKPTA